MSKKRVADSYLTHDNWDRQEDKDDDDEPKTGPFQAASEKVLAKRTFKKAARRIKPGEKASAPANPFGAFGGFGGGSSTNAGSAAAALATAAKPTFSFAPQSDTATKGAFSGFSFKLGSGSTDEKPSEVGPAKIEEKAGGEKGEKKEDEYFVQLASLNVSVMKWIDKHVEENSCVNLVPVFKDYEKHLKTISSSAS